MHNNKWMVIAFRKFLLLHCTNWEVISWAPLSASIFSCLLPAHHCCSVLGGQSGLAVRIGTFVIFEILLQLLGYPEHNRQAARVQPSQLRHFHSKLWEMIKTDWQVIYYAVVKSSFIHIDCPQTRFATKVTRAKIAIVMMYSYRFYKLIFLMNFKSDYNL